jgi:hypothetical protein
MRLLAVALAAALVTGWAAAPAFAAGGTTYTWVGNSQDVTADNHSWTDSRNWSPSGVPGDGDSVSIDAPDAAHCTAHVDNVPAVALTNFSLAATRCSSSVTGGAITVTGAFSWNGGTLFTPTTIAGTGVLSGSNSHLSALSAELDVSGSLTLSGVADSGASNSGGFRIVNPYVLHVLAGGTLTSSGANAVQFLSCCNAPARIVNDGTLQVSSGDFTVRAVEVDQNGTLSAASGGRLVTVGAPLTAAGGATYTGSGGWKIENGAKARLSGTQTIGTGFHLELGGLDVDAGAELGGTATLTGSGAVDWTGGTIEGNLTIAHGMTVHVSGAHAGNGKRFLSGQDGLSSFTPSTVTNHGAITVDQGAAVLTGYQAKLVNASDGTLTLAPETQFTTLSCCLNPSRIVDNGAVVVPAGTSSEPVVFAGVAYQAAGGTTSVATGRTLQVNAAPSSFTSTAIAGGGTLAIAAPTAVSGTIAVASATTLALHAGGSLNGTATLGGSGVLSWTGGAISGNVTVAATGGVRISGPDVKSVANVGGGSTPSTLTVKSHAAVLAGTATKHNRLDLGYSTLTLASSTSVANDVEISYGTLINTGSLAVDPGSTGLVERGGATAFVNRGTLTVRRGTLRVDGSYTQPAGVTNVLAGAHLDLLYTTRAISLAGGVLEGTGTIGASVDNTRGTVRPGGTATGTLHISGAYKQGAHGTLALDLARATRDLLAVKGTASLGGCLAAHDVGSYRPALGAKYRGLVAANLVYALSCARTSGTGSSSGHWAPSHTASALYLTWRRGSRTHC